MRFDRLFEGIAYACQCGTALPTPDAEIIGVVTDAKEAAADKLFLCTRTALHNHHFDADAAYAAGCRFFAAERGLALPSDATVLILPDTCEVAGELAARCLAHPARELTVFGITGGVGKSALAHILCALLRRGGMRAASITTDGVDLNGGVTPHGSILPDAVALQALLRHLRDEGVEIVILELSQYQLAMKVHKGIDFTVLLHTGNKPRAVDPAVKHPTVADHDTLFLESAAISVAPVGTRLPPCGKRIFTGEGGQIFVSDAVESWGEQGFFTQFKLHISGGEVLSAALPLPCEWAVQQAPLAVAAALAVGMSPAEIAAHLTACHARGRMECIGSLRGRLVFTDVAYTPRAVAETLRLLRARTRGKLTVLLGSVGGRAVARRAPLGQAAEQGAELVYLTADDPDTEPVGEICREMAAGFCDPSRYVIVPDRRAAILRAVRELRPGDTLLLCGKGGEERQLLGGKYLPFSEKEIVLEAMTHL